MVSRIIDQLGGQLRVKSDVGEGSTFSCLIPLGLPPNDTDSELSIVSSMSSGASSMERRQRSLGSVRSDQSEMNSLVAALGADHMSGSSHTRSITAGSPVNKAGSFDIPSSSNPVRAVKVDAIKADFPVASVENPTSSSPSPLRVLIVEVCIPSSVPYSY